MANLVVCSDGTWNTPDDMDGGVPAPTNVVKLFNALAASDANGTEQKKYYHPGVGTDGGWWNRLVGGGAGEGLDRNIKSGYQWLAKNYRPNDNIFLFGFSRGAYTARSLGGMITSCGLLDLSDATITPAEGWQRVDSVFDCYRARADKSKFKALSTHLFSELAFHNKPAAEPIAMSTPIFFIGVWDTVGALGIPDDMALLNLLDSVDKHSFHDTNLSNAVVNARHAVAMDEHRQSFTPTLWTNVGNRAGVKQVWFPGVHSDVGGGYGQVGLSDGALKWMIEEAGALNLKFRDHVEDQIKPDPRGMLHDSVTTVFKALKTCPRNVPNVGFRPVTGDFHASACDRFDNPPLQQSAFWPTRELQVGQSMTVDVFAREHWNATGLFLSEGGEYELTANGEWLDSHIKCGPGGTNDGKFQIGEIFQLAGSALGGVETMFRKATGNKDADFWGTKRAEEYPWFALIGVVANGSGADERGNPIPHTTFLIGDRHKHKVKTGGGGYLYCFANDAWQLYGNNSGSVSLTVKRTA